MSANLVYGIKTVHLTDVQMDNLVVDTSAQCYGEVIGFLIAESSRGESVCLDSDGSKLNGSFSHWKNDFLDVGVSPSRLGIYLVAD